MNIYIMTHTISLIFILLLSCQKPSTPVHSASHIIAPILPGAYSMNDYLHTLEDKKIGCIVNHTSMISNVHLVDTLLAEGVDIQAIFSPEHGFKGDADAGETIADGKYLGRIPLYSLYGKTKKPTAQMLEGLDALIFDIQDVGTRFYTYISTMHYVMEAAAEQDIDVIVLDRPNPNGHYVDGPVLDTTLRSFVGMHPVPIVYGMTIGEYALMINGENWLANEVDCELLVIPCTNYTHQSQYELPIAPSPNLPNSRSIALYPHLCLFEGTTVSVGRGTDRQFQVFGHPAWDQSLYSFKPVSSYGAKYPKHQDKVCYGYDLTTKAVAKVRDESHFNLDYLISAYNHCQDLDIPFFNENNFFEKLAGTKHLRTQILNGMNEADIRAEWHKDLEAFKVLRQKYLIYP